jgi:uncharacterized protein (DUF1810 family)
MTLRVERARWDHGPVADDPHDLQRFVDAQDTHDRYAAALRELQDGRKVGHWMWFVFPQIAGLGHSATAQHFAISGLSEAVAYLAHPVLGPRLLESARALTGLPHHDPVAVLGSIDALKLHSSMTLFSLAAPDERVFREVLDQYYAGATDHGTTSRV